MSNTWITKKSYSVVWALWNLWVCWMKIHLALHLLVMDLSWGSGRDALNQAARRLGYRANRSWQVPLAEMLEVRWVWVSLTLRNLAKEHNMSTALRSNYRWVPCAFRHLDHELNATRQETQRLLFFSRGCWGYGTVFNTHKVNVS